MSMNDPLVSVHIITYNQESYVARAIEGALRQQTDFGVEIVVGEDCSTDGTRDVVVRYQRERPEQVRVITSDHNVGPFENSQRVLTACRGRYVAFCEGDDYWTDPRKLQKQVDFLEAHPAYSLCCHDVDVVCDGVSRVCTYVEFTKDTFAFDDAVRGHFIPTPSIVCRRELVADVPSWLKECIGVDIFVELLLLDRGLGCYLHEAMAVKVENARGISRIPETRTQAARCILRMYRNLDLHTEGRHRDILRWKIAQLNLILANENLKGKRFASFLRHVWDSLGCDPTVVGDAIRKRFRGLLGVHPQ
jgi:glycosyltransferase involved in cell wall biosynthesis